jgi:hypothetical protein
MTEYCFSLKKPTEIESVFESIFLITSTNKPCLRRLALAQPWNLTSSLQIQPMAILHQLTSPQMQSWLRLASFKEEDDNDFAAVTLVTAAIFRPYIMH